jgi:hypothetical protein
MRPAVVSALTVTVWSEGLDTGISARV